MREPNEIVIGDAEKALAEAEASVDLTFTTPRYNHNAIELHAATVAWEDDRLVIHDASQLVTQTASTIAGMFNLKADKVRVTVAVCRRRLRRKMSLGPPDSRRGRGEARRAGRCGSCFRAKAFIAVVGGRTPDRTARGARRDAGRQADRAHPHRSRGDQRRGQLPRAVHVPGAPPLCGERDQDRTGSRRHGHARQYLHARARRIDRHLRARMRDRRACGKTWHGSHRLSARDRAGEGPDVGPSVLQSQSHRGLRGRRRSGSAGSSARLRLARAAMASG